MNRIELTVARQALDLPLPDTWRILGVHRPRPLPRLPDPGRSLRAALDAPIGMDPVPRLDGKRILLVVDDASRPTPVHTYFRDLLRWLEERGARREDLRVLFALGVHRPMTREEAASKLGEDCLEGLRWENPDCRNPALLEDFGTSRAGTPIRLHRGLRDADWVILVGAIEPHPLLGFGGGLKMILPGLAGEETIAQNHMQGVTPDAFNYVGVTESPMRLDLEEAALRIGRPILLVNAVLSEDGGVARFACGDPIAAHRAGAGWVRDACRLPVCAPADVAVVSSHPMDADLRQGMKAIAHAERAVRDGGVIVALLACRNGIGDVAIPPRSLPHGVLRTILRAIGPTRILGFVDRVKRGAGTEERFLSHFSLQVVRRTRILVWSPFLPADTGRRMGIFQQFESPADLIEAAAWTARRRATVHVFPCGGASYPVVE